MNRPTVLMAKVGTATFVERDEAILSEEYQLKVFRFATGGLGFLWSVVLFKLWILRNIWTADLLFTRFAHYHAFLLGVVGKIFRKKVAIVVGGSDAIWIPRYHYGVYDHWLSRHTTPWALRMASLILPNHASLVKGVNTYSDEAPRPEGLLAYTPDLQTPIRVVHNGFDSQFWRPDPNVRRERMVLDVAPSRTQTVFMTKGLDYYLQTAALLSDVEFFLVGVTQSDAERWSGLKSTQNVRFLPQQSPEQLRTLYSRASVFAHFTLTEGMPNVLCEAMLCECVPVGSNVNSLPDIIGDTGFLVAKRDPQLMKQAIVSALHSKLGPAARKRIAEQYPRDRRARELIAALNELIDGGKH